MALAELWLQYEMSRAESMRADREPYSDEEASARTRRESALAERIRRADPSDLAGIVIQMRLLADQLGLGGTPAEADFAAQIAARLERLLAA